MSERFLAVDRDTPYLLPPSVQDWLPEEHLARFVVEVASKLDLRDLEKEYAGRGSKAYHPEMLLALLFYGYATGVFASRKLEQATWDSLAFRYIAANTHPDHDTIAAFRKRFLKQLKPLFVQILLLARTMGFLKLGKISLDGSKVQANASKHSALSWGHATELEEQLKAEGARLMELAAAAAAEVPEGMDIPAELKRREDRLKAIADAKAKIEARAAERHAAEQAEYKAKMAQRKARAKATGKRPGGKPPQPPQSGVRPNDQINLTDEESRIMPAGGKSFQQAYSEAPTVRDAPSIGDGPWAEGDTVEVSLTFSEAVTVDTKQGMPTIGIQLSGSEDREAAYLRGSKSAVLVFGYTVTQADGDHTSMFVSINSLALNGGTIQSTATATNAVLDHNGAVETAAPIGGRPETPETPGPTAWFGDVPESHNGSTQFNVELHFSENIPDLSYTTVGAGLLEVTGGTVTGAGRLTAGSNQGWSITIDPTQDADVVVRLPVRACGATNAICVDGRALAQSASVTVPMASVPFTASLSSVPREHDGATKLSLRLSFSEEPAALSYKTVKDSLFSVTGGSIQGAGRVTAGSNRHYNIEVAPSGNGPVRLTVSTSLPACGTTGEVCSPGGQPLTGGLSATVPGPAALSVADASVEEAADAKLAFAVTLDRPRHAPLTVDYATGDVTATAGEDYTAASGTLTFAAGETVKTVEVAVLDDAHDEGTETMTFALSNPVGARIANGEATGTIENSDPMPQAYLARFGRAAAMHVVEHVEERLQAPRAPGFEGRFAGQELRPGMEREMALNLLSRLGGWAGANPAGASDDGPMSGLPSAGAGSVGMPGRSGGGAGPAATAGREGGGGSLNGGDLLQMGLGGGDLRTGSSFVLNRKTGDGGILSFWSRGARSSFQGREGTLALDGDVRTTMFGADYAKGRMVAGLSLALSRSLGGYQAEGAGQVDSAVTGLYPWLGYRLTDRVSVWGVTGYGAGWLTLTPGAGAPLESGLSMAMAAGGTRGDLVAGGAGGFALAFKADVLWVGTGIDGVDGPAGRLAATEASVTRLRTGLEGSRGYTLGNVLSLKPIVEVALRHDGGDADTGAGMDLGGGLTASAPLMGLSVDVRVRTLLVHQAEGFRDRGMSVSFGYNPTPGTPLGFAAKVAPSWGGQATSGAEALWGRETMAGAANGGAASGNRLESEVSYGLPLGRRFVGTPRVGFTTSESGRDYRMGYSLGLLNGERLGFELGLDGQRQEYANRNRADYALVARFTARW